jgi:diacylglycerol kinase (ATP)
MASLLVLANPKARLFRREPSMLHTLSVRVGAAGTFAAPPDFDALRGVLVRAKEEGVRCIAVAGGDGTFGHTCTKLLDVYGDSPLPVVVPLRGGTMNTAARGIGIGRGSPLGRLDALLRTDIDGLRVIRQPILRERRLGDSEGRCGFLFGTGVFASFLMAYYDAGNGNPGPSTAAQVLARFVGSALVGGPFAKRFAERTSMEVVVDGETFRSSEYLAVAAGTVPEVGLGFSAFTRTRPGDPRFEIVAVHAPASKVAVALPSVFRGEVLGDDVAHSQLARSVILRSEKPFVYMLDGDLYAPTNELRLDVRALVPIGVLTEFDRPRFEPDTRTV